MMSAPKMRKHRHGYKDIHVNVNTKDARNSADVFLFYTDVNTGQLCAGNGRG